MVSPVSSYSFLIGHRGLQNAQAIVRQAAERLMTGKRINRAADDPSGLIAVDEFTAHIKKVEAKIEAFNLEEARLGAKEGALSVVNEMLHELNALVVTAANKGALDSTDREALQIQADEILKGLDLIANTAVFNGEQLFGSLFTTSLGRVTYRHKGDNGEEESGETTLAGLRSGGAINLIDGDLEAAQRSIEGALGSIHHQRAAIGARITNEINPLRNELLVELEVSAQARSDIEDADIAREMSNLIRGQILEQASISVLLIGRQAPRQALQLLSANLAIAQQT